MFTTLNLNLCSSCDNFYVQLEVVRKLFNLNGFPSYMVGRFVRRFLNNIFEPKLTVHTVSRRIDHFCLPFLHCLTLASNSHSNHPTLQCCLSTFQHSMCLLFLFSHLLFSFKGKVPKFMRSGVLYLFKSQCFSASYVGETTRHLHTRKLGNFSYNRKTVIQSSHV